MEYLKLEQHIIGLVRIFEDIQSCRKEIENRLRSLREDTMLSDQYGIGQSYLEGLFSITTNAMKCLGVVGMERELKKEIAKEASKHPLIAITKVNGIDAFTVGKLIKLICCGAKCSNGVKVITKRKGSKDKWENIEVECPYWRWCQGHRDIRRFPNPAKLQAYLGLDNDPLTGAAKALYRKDQLDYRKKSWILGVLARNLKLKKSYYKLKVYDVRREKTRNDPKYSSWSLRRKDYDATRVMAKRFIADLWDYWYKILGLEPPSEPYAVKVLGHQKQPSLLELILKNGDYSSR